jgi:hypothetical protein
MGVMKSLNILIGAGLGLTLALASGGVAAAQPVHTDAALTLNFQYVFGGPGAVSQVDTGSISYGSPNFQSLAFESGNALATHSNNWSQFASASPSPGSQPGYHGLNIDVTTGATATRPPGDSVASIHVKAKDLFLLTMNVTQDLSPEFNFNYLLNSGIPFSPGSPLTSSINFDVDIFERITGIPGVAKATISRHFSSIPGSLGNTENFALPAIDGQYTFYLRNLDVYSIASVPEPATWAIMLVGFGGIGTAIRARRRIATTAA